MKLDLNVFEFSEKVLQPIVYIFIIGFGVENYFETKTEAAAKHRAAREAISVLDYESKLFQVRQEIKNIKSAYPEKNRTELVRDEIAQKERDEARLENMIAESSKNG